MEQRLGGEPWQGLSPGGCCPVSEQRGTEWGAQQAESKQSLSLMGDGLGNGPQLPGAPGKGKNCEALWRDSLQGLPHIP